MFGTMCRERRCPDWLLASVLTLTAAVALRAHPEWNALHLVYSAPTEFIYPFDGRTPKIVAVLLNHHETPSAEVTFTFSVNGALQSANAFPQFPDGGNILVPADEVGYASVPTGAIYDGRAGAAPALGETKSFAFHFDFKLAGPNPPPDVLTIVPGVDNDSAVDPPGTVNATVKFTNLGENPALSGPVVISGTLRFPTIAGSPPVANVLIEIATPFSNWFKIPAAGSPSGAGPAFTFSQALPFRNDWHLRFSADGYETRVVAYGSPDDPHSPYDVTLTPAATPAIDFRRAANIATPTGFWRGAVSESEGTFVAFPGQQNWKAAATDAEARALRVASRLVKYNFDGTKLWEHLPGWETWAGDMTSDGHYVAYALNPTATSFYTPAENKLVLLDGATGVPVWTRSGPPNDPAIGGKLASLELAFSPDGKWIAVGSTGGQVTLVDRATGNFAWSVPGTAPTFGQVRRLRFSADAQFLFCGSGDSTLRKLRVSDGAMLWRIYTGGPPSLNGLELSPDGTWVTIGTASLDTSLVRTSDGFTSWRKETQFVDAMMAPDGRHVATLGGQIIRVSDGSIAGMTKLSGLSRFTADGRWLFKLDRAFTLHDLGGKLLRNFGDTGLPAGGAQWAHVTRDGRYAILLARDMTAPAQTGIVIFERVSSPTPTVAPAVFAQPLAQAATLGASATLSVTANGTAPLSYQWSKNGAEISGATSPVLAFTATSAADAANYTCVIANTAGTIATAPAALAVVARDATNPARLAYISVSARFGAGSVPLIVGFTVGGTGSAANKRLLLRGAGPSLAAFGLHGLSNPRLALLSGSTVLATNDDWGGDPATSALAAQVGAFPFASVASQDAALAALPIPGGYSVQLSSSDLLGEGQALAEIYDGSSTFTADTPRLINLSARYNVSPADPLTAGFVIAGPAACTVLVRGVGPALTQFGVIGALSDPQITLYRESAFVATNDDWPNAPNAVAIAGTAARVGAFALPTDSRDAALLLSLPPGNYSAQVTAANGSGSNTLVEIYAVP
jgi:hypothetical protein